jgi:hypothetical protein
MSRYDDLLQAMDKGTDELRTQERVCHLAAKAIGESLDAYLGQKVSSYFKWDECTPAEKMPLHKSGVWEEREHPEMTLGLGIFIDSPTNFNHMGYKLTLKPSGSGVIVSIEDKSEVFVSYNGTSVSFPDTAAKQSFLDFLYDDLKAELATPANRTANPKRKIGFHASGQ